MTWYRCMVKKILIILDLTIIMDILAPVALCFWMTSFKNMISVIFIVMSSSFLKRQKWGWFCFTLKSPYSQLHAFNHWRNATYVPALRSETTEGRIQMGGTRIRVNIRSFGLPTSGFIINSGISCRESKHQQLRLWILKLSV